MTAMLETVTFPPTGDTLWARRDNDGRIFVAVKPICEAIGLGWVGQHQRIRRTPALQEGMCIMHTPSAGGVQQAVCLPLDLLPGWLFGVDVNRVKPDLRARLIAYQRDCHRVLFDHFVGDLRAAALADDMAEASPVEADAPPSAVALPGLAMPGHENGYRLWLDIINQARLVAGRDAARNIWRQSPLPPLETDAVPAGPDWIDLFLSDCTEPAPAERVASELLWQAYLSWCGRRGVDPLSRKGFGLAAGSRLRTVKSSINYYSGIRLTAGSLE